MQRNTASKTVHVELSKLPRLGRRGTPVRIGPGRPSKIQLCGLFMPSPFSVMALDGMPPRKVGAELGMESLFRRAFAPPTADNGEPPATLIADARAMIHGLSLPESIKAPLLQALDGDLAASVFIHSLGSWQMTRLGMSNDAVSWFSVVVDHGVELEVAGRAVDELVRGREFDRLPTLLRSNLALAPYMTSMAIDCLSEGTPEGAKTIAMTAGTCEFLLSQVARVDVHPSPELGERSGQRFAEMSANRTRQCCLPSRGFVDWMMLRYGASSLAELWSMAPSDENGRRHVAYNALQSWHTGTNAPNRNKAEGFVMAIARSRGLRDDELRREWRLFDVQLWAACRLEGTLRLVRFLAAIKPSPGIPGILKLLEAKDADDWCRRRYSCWVEHWRLQQPTGLAVA